MSDLITVRDAGGNWVQVPLGEPSVEIVTGHNGRHTLRYYRGDRELCQTLPRDYRWKWRARRAARRWLTQQRHEPQVEVIR